MKLQPTLVRGGEAVRITRQEATLTILAWRCLTSRVKRYSRADGKAYLAYSGDSDGFSSTLILTE